MKTSDKDTLQPDAALADIIGDKPRSRTDILQDFWRYIKEEGLLDSRRRVVSTDKKLKPVLGDEKKVNIFAIAKLVEEHVSLVDSV